ncbi:hypothetical protein V1264_001290 [Littorina saxatilis]
MWISASRSATFLQRLEIPPTTSRQTHSAEKSRGDTPVPQRKTRHSASFIRGDGDGFTARKTRAAKDTGDCDDFDNETTETDSFFDRPIYNTALDTEQQKRKKESVADRTETPTSTPNRIYKSALKKDASPLDKKLFKDNSSTSPHRLLRSESSPKQNEDLLFKPTDEPESIASRIKRKVKNKVSQLHDLEVTPEVIGKVARSPKFVHFSDDEETTEDEGGVCEEETKSIFWDKSTLYLLIVFIVLRLLYETSSDGFAIFPGVLEEGDTSIFEDYASRAT